MKDNYTQSIENFSNLLDSMTANELSEVHEKYKNPNSASLAEFLDKYHFELIERNWYKRRYPIPDPDVVSFQVIDYKQEENYFCKVIFVYDNNTVKTMIGRVIQNKIKGHWTIDCMHHALLVSENT